MSKKEEKAQEIPGPRKTPDSSVEGYQHPEQVEPRTITPSRFLQYQSIELKRLDNTFVRLRRSLPYLGKLLFTQADACFWDCYWLTITRDRLERTCLVKTETEDSG